MPSVTPHIYSTKLEIQWDDGRCCWRFWEPWSCEAEGLQGVRQTVTVISPKLGSVMLKTEISLFASMRSHESNFIFFFHTCHTPHWMSFCWNVCYNDITDRRFGAKQMWWHVLLEPSVWILDWRHMWEWQMTLTCKLMLTTGELGHTSVI